MVEDGLILARFLHYAATTTLAGLSFFPLYAYAGGEPEAFGCLATETASVDRRCCVTERSLLVRARDRKYERQS